MSATQELLRIGELSRRVGVSPDLLRAWERRYGLLQPARSGGGLRLYGPDDVDRVERMQRHLAQGIAAAEAAALALLEEDSGVPALDSLRAELADALEAFDEPRAQAIIDRLLAVATVDTLLGHVVVPYLKELGDRWERGEASVAQEHFASSLLRGRLLGLGRGWGLGVGPLAILACVPREQHDLGLFSFGLALRARGWRVVYLGPDAPIDTVAQAGARLRPSLIVLNAVAADLIRPILTELRKLARAHRVALGGRAAADPALDRTGILRLTGDPATEAARVTAAA
jgi:DNA-binding transcriptional MerR regulator